MVARKLDFQKKQHRERGQLSHRSRLGLLEKRKDYLLRAKDYKSKQRRITHLRRKASERNKDEFYFEMIKTKTKSGLHIQTQSKVLETDLVKILKHQDESYIKTQCSMEEKRVQKLVLELGSRLDISTPSTLEHDESIRKEILELLERDYTSIGANSEDLKNNVTLKKNSSSTKILQPRKTVFVDSIHQVKTFQQKIDKGKSKSKIDTPTTTTTTTNLSLMLETLKSRILRLRTLQQASSNLSLTKQLMSNGSKRNTNATPPRKTQGWNSDKSQGWFDKLDKKEERELEDQRERERERNRGIKTGTKVWKWKAERKR